MKITPDQSTLVVVHTGRQVAGQTRYGVAMIDIATGQLLPVANPPVGGQPGFRRWHPACLRHGHLPRRHLLRRHQRVGWRPPADQRHRRQAPHRRCRQRRSRTGCREPSTRSTPSRSPKRPSTSVATSAGSSPRPPATRGPGLDDQGYGTGQGLSGYGLGDDVVRRDHIGAIDLALGKALEFNPGSNSFEGNKAMLVTPRGLITGGDATTQGGTERRPDRGLRPACRQRRLRTRRSSPRRSRDAWKRLASRSPSRAPPRRPAACSGSRSTVRDRAHQPLPAGRPDDLGDCEQHHQRDAGRTELAAHDLVATADDHEQP